MDERRNQSMPGGIGDVAATAFLTLFCHAIESRSDNPILTDPKSVEIAAGLVKTLSGSEHPLAKTLVAGTVDKRLVVHIAIRAKKYDDYAREFLARSPEGVVVNIGCGFDPRFFRIDNGRVSFYDLDLPEIIVLKEQYLPETDRYHLIASSVLDFSWMGLIRRHTGPFLFMAEGLFMYLDESDVRSLVLELRRQFPGSGLVCEVVNSAWLRPPIGKMLEFKLQREAHLGKDAMFRSGIRDSREMEEWDSKIRFLDEWSYFDSDEKKLGWLRIFRHIPFVRKVQWTVRYLLG